MLTNGKIYTVDSKQPWAEAIAVKGNEIVFVGSSENAGKFVGDNTRVADLEGRMVLPGMIDSHLHAILGAIAGSGVWVAEIPDIDGVLAAISEYANAHPEKAVIFGWGYGLTLFGPEGPSRELLDKAESDRPVYIIRGDGHSAWANTKALALAGVDKNTPDPAPPAGVFGRDADGNPTGAINGGPANVWMLDHLPGAILPESIKDAATPMLNAIAEEGITTIFDSGAVFATDASFQALVDLDKAVGLPLRYFAGYYINAASRSLPSPSASTSAYCQARAKLEISELETILSHTASTLHDQGRTERWKGRRVVVDGTGLSMPDTAENQAVWP